MSNFWDDRYSRKEYIYGTSPNEFFKTQLDKIKPGKLLMLAEGEGRNAVYAAKHGWNVDAVDSSQQAKVKALNLAGQNNITINYEVESLNIFIPERSKYDALGIIFVHLDQELIKKVHARAIEALKPGGKIILQVFEKEQLGRKSGGPDRLELLCSIDDVKNNFETLSTEILNKEKILLSEGQYHSGEAVVINFVGKK